MRILYITPSFQHPKMRGPTRCYYFMRELSQRHEITLLALAPDPIDPVAYEEVQNYAQKIVTVPVRSMPSSRGKLLRRITGPGGKLRRERRRRAAILQMRAAFQQLVRQARYDLVLFHGKHLYPILHGFRKLPVVIDFCDATSMRLRQQVRYASSWKRPLIAARYVQIRLIEQKLLRISPHAAFISLRDRRAIAGPNYSGALVPIGVDLAFWTRRQAHREPKSLVFTGVMNYAPNEDAAMFLIKRILPHLRQAVPGIKTYIVGREPTAALKKHAARYPDIEVTGFVDDVRDYLERATVFVAPLRYGAGVQNKLLEAMAMQVPVVTTPVAAAGLQVDENSDPPVRCGDDPQAIAQQVIDLLNDPAVQAELAQAGRRYVETHFVWEKSAAVLENLCLKAAGQHPGARSTAPGSFAHILQTFPRSL